MNESLNNADQRWGATHDLSQDAYDQLHRIAEQLLRERRWASSPQTTSLIHEAYVRLAKRDQMQFHSRSHFLQVAARAMRFVMVDQVRRQTANRRGGGKTPAVLTDEIVPANATNPNLIALHDALLRLEEFDKQKARVVELRFFGGFTIDEAAQALCVSPATVKREWAFAKAWLFRELSSEDSPPRSNADFPEQNGRTP